MPIYVSQSSLKISILVYTDVLFRKESYIELQLTIHEIITRIAIYDNKKPRNTCKCSSKPY